jgi:tetratricopeptide (TPR) repeat protein
LPVEALDLGPFSEEEHRALLAHVAPGIRAAATTELYHLSEGNPLFAVELARLRRRSARTEERSSEQEDGVEKDDVPPSLRRAVRDRVERLSPAARHLLAFAAVVGREVPYVLLEAAGQGGGGGPDSALLDLLDELIEAGLVEERGLHYRFRHVLLASAVGATVTEARRRALHAQVARILVRLHPREGEAPVEQIAYHYARAGDARQAVHYLTLAGVRAEAVYAHEDALARFREALALLGAGDDPGTRRARSALLSRIGDACRAAGYLGASLAAYEDALAQLHDLPVTGPDRAELHRRIALVAITATAMDRAAAHLAEAWRLVGPDPRAHARLHVLRALLLWHYNRLEEAAAYARRALALAEAVGATAEAAQACEVLAMAYLPAGRWDEGLEAEQRRLRYGGWSPDIVVATDAHLCLWEYHVRGEQPFEQASAFIEGVAEEAGRLGDLRCVAVCHYALGTMHLWRGEAGRALDRLETSLALHERVGSPAGMAYTLARRATLHTLAGALDAGWEAMHEGLVHAEQAAVRDHSLQRLYGIGLWNRIEADDRAGAADLMARSEALLDASGPCATCGAELLPWMAFILLREGLTDEAAAHAETLERLASLTGNPVVRAFAALVRAGLASARGEAADAEALRAEAVRFAEGAALGGTASPVARFFDRMGETFRSA